MTALTDAPVTSGAASAEPRTYGGWRRRRGIGLGNLDARQTILVLTAIVVVLVSAAVSLKLALVLAVPALAIVAVAVAHWDGVWVTDAALARLRFAVAARRGETTYRSGVVVAHPRAWQLPGVLAATRCLDVEDGEGGTYGLVWDRRSGLLTATLRVAATGTMLADAGESDAWVANWAGWLAALGDEPTVRWVTVTVDTAPDPGSTLAERVERHLDPAAPEAARAIMAELVAASPGAAAQVDTRVSITFDTDRAPDKPANLLEAAAEASRTLRGLEVALAGCGLSVLGRASAAELAGIVRACFDPAARGQVAAALAGPDPAAVLEWADAGPAAAEESWDRYAHDSGTSVTWATRDAPRQQVTSQVMTRLVAPGRWPRRVTFAYQVFPADAAAKVVEAERNAAAFRTACRQRTRRDETARDTEDRARAERAAVEESQGAGVALWSIYVTTTVADETQLPAACADVEQRAGATKLRLRRMYGSQAAGFAATLPCGVYPPYLAGRARH